MARYGFIHDKLDIKLLILYLTARAAAPLDLAALTDLAMCDEGVDYFSFTQAVSELVESEHLLLEQDAYAITEKGRRNGSICEESLPFSVRQKCDRSLAQLNARLRQDAQIRAEILPRPEGGFTTRMILDDHQGNLMTLELYSPTREQADRLSSSFRANHEGVYRAILTALLEGEIPEE